MTTKRTAILRAITTLFAGALAWGQSGPPGHVNFLEYAQAEFDPFTQSPNGSQVQWMDQNLAAMVVWSPYFDTRTSWYPNAYFYQDLYAIYPGTWPQSAHPEWILHDQYGNWLYIPFGCGGGVCTQYAGDIANPAFRAWWISQAQAAASQGNYAGIFIDDVNMNFNVSDGWGNLVAPIDSNTGQVMSYTAWRSYVASFTQEIRAALPSRKIIHNAIWFAGPGISDYYIQNEISAADTINLERGIASDGGLTGGTGYWSVYNWFNYVDGVHSLGKGVNLGQYTLNGTGLQYGLASYFLLSTGADFISDQTSTPDNWYNGYNVNLGNPLGPRTYNNGIFQRNFSGGIVLLAEPNLGTQTVQLGGSYQDLNGNWVSSVTLSGWQGAILLGNNGGSSPSSVPAPPPVTSNPPVQTGSGVTRYLSDIGPNYTVNGYGNIQVNKNQQGTTLSLNGVQYGHGLGVNAYSELHWPLYGNCSSFTATVGIDSSIPQGMGSVDFQVWGDGHVLYDSGFLKGGSQAPAVNVNLTGYQTLGLIVTNGTYMAPPWTTYDDNGDWVNPIIVCAN